MRCCLFVNAKSESHDTFGVSSISERRLSWEDSSGDGTAVVDALSTPILLLLKSVKVISSVVEVIVDIG